MKKRAFSLLLAGCLTALTCTPVWGAGTFSAEQPEALEESVPEALENGFSSEDSFYIEETPSREEASPQDFLPEETAADEEPLYQGQEANYEDPQFSNYIEEGFFTATPGEKANYGSVHDDRFDGYTILDGIDVSQWNGDIDWETVADNVDFAFVRAGYRGTGNGSLNPDPYFDDNILESRKAGLDVGVYLYSQAITQEEAREEAAYLLSLVEGYEVNLPLVIDYEYAEGGRLAEADLTNQERTDICLAFCEEIEKAGYDAMIYANQTMLTEDLYGEDLIDAGHQIWMAQYRSASTYTGEYHYWQYSDVGSVPGITGNVDLNYHYLAEGEEPEEPQEPTPDEPLDTPSLSGATLIADGVEVSWEAVPGASGYLVFRRTGNEKWISIGHTEDTSFLDQADLTFGTSYTYTVRAYRGSYEEADAHKYEQAYWSGYSPDGILFTYLETPALSDVETIADGVKFTWKKVTGAKSYDVYRRGQGESWQKIASTKSTSYTDEAQLKSGTIYAYTVRAIAGDSRSSYISPGLKLRYLATPQLKTIDSTATGAKLTWEKVPGAKGYDIYRRVPGESWKKIDQATSTTYVDGSSFDTETTYIYTVRAFHGKDRSYYVNTGIKYQYLPTPKLYSISQSPSGIRFRFHAVEGAEGYQIYRRSLGKSWEKIAETKSTTFTDKSDLQSGTTYVYTVRAYKGDVRSGYENTGIRIQYH